MVLIIIFKTNKYKINSYCIIIIKQFIHQYLKTVCEPFILNVFNKILYFKYIINITLFIWVEYKKKVYIKKFVKLKLKT